MGYPILKMQPETNHFLLFWHKQFGPRSGPIHQNAKSELSLIACYSDRIPEKKFNSFNFFYTA